MLTTLYRGLWDLLVSLKLMVVLIVFSCVLILAATLDQVNLGIWAVQEKYFRTFIVYWQTGNLNLPLFPGGYTIGGLLLINLLGAHFFRFQWTWKKAGIWLAHAGLIILLVGELLTGIWQDDYYLRLNEGETTNFSESHRHVELALIDTSAPDADTVVAIPEGMLERGESVQHPDLPFRVTIKNYFPHSALQMRSPHSGAAPSEADRGVGPQVVATPLPMTYRPKERNLPSALVELAGADGPIGTWLVSTLLEDLQAFTYAGRTWRISLRFARHYKPYALTLLKFSHDRYAGTEIPKNFSSRVHLATPDGRDDREVLIYMNNPLRYAGLTFYQAGFENDDRTSILQVVRNPSWLMPYIACTVMTLGLLIQFGIHLVGFVRHRPVASRAAATGAGPRPGGVYPWIVLGLAAVVVLYTLFPPRAQSDYDLTGFGQLPTLVNGRIKPLDTVARTSLLVLQGRQRVKAPDGSALTPVEWLLDAIYRPEAANRYQHFEIVHPDVLALLNLAPEEGDGNKRFSFVQVRESLSELDRQAQLAGSVEHALRSPFQRAVVQLHHNIILFQRLQGSLMVHGAHNYLEQLARFDTLVAEGLAAAHAQHAGAAGYDQAAARRLGELNASFSALESFGYLLPIPPETAKSNPAGWRNAGTALRESLPRGRLDPSVATYVALGLAWRNDQPQEFNRLVQEYRAGLDREAPGIMRKSDVEALFNSAGPFYTSAVLYVVAFLIAAFSWLRWPGALGRTAFWLTALAFVLSTLGIATRMWLEGRPPVTNLYSSALFVGWGAVALCLVLEGFYKNAIGSVAAGLIGFGSLLIAHHLSLGGDTLEMMRAVLDSNFWLATHVITITIGYSATYLAGFLALIYVVRGVFTRSLDKATADSLNRMVFGIICFATLFNFVGTVLGGIWADQSWGRFWGWDPKENGALIIVLWNALILHARWGGLVKTRGLMNLAIFGNIVTSWSWFGVNMLGVGLHSYGFMDSAFWWLLVFAVSQLVLIAVATLPISKWRSSMIAQTV